MPVTPYPLVPAAVGQQRPNIFLAAVSSSKPAPSTFTDPLYVVEPSRPNVYLTIPEFPAVHGDALPAAGATCVIQRSLDPTEPLRCLYWDGSFTSTAMNAPTTGMTSQSRSFGTTYQPNTTRPTMVIVTFIVPSSGANCFAKVLMDAANPPTTAIALAQTSSADASLVQNEIPVTFMVPAAFRYEFVVGAGSPTIASTFEMTL